ncbi:snRNA-activating protein complex subunit 1 [Crotalus tigris]|uniref:snRNA-activating protein complex subunit 1 n=1 Tax=Crotalus tigris TaxID=88082 RepID=UPI00192F8A9E|nr:snRNA-activating protein complex subunit 1 [Crotalus tigris]
MNGWPGLRTDCEALLTRFQQAESVRFEDFALLWRQNRFHTIFYGKIRTPEQIKFTKEALALVWPYFLPPYTLQIRVGALYLLYGLYNTQLCKPKQKIRVALKDWAEVSKFKQELLDAQYYDAAYIFRNLRMDKAFYFTAMPKFLSFRTKKNMHENTEMKREFIDPTDRVAMLCHENFLEETKNIHEHYQRMKCLISKDKSQPDKTISLIKDDFITKFQDTILDYQQWQKKKMESPLSTVGDEMRNRKEGCSQESEGSGRAKTLADIKARSYSSVAQASKSRRHRQVKLESSELGSNRGKTRLPMDRRVRKCLPTAKKAEHLQNRGRLLVTTQENTERLNMPVIGDDDGDEEQENDHSSDEDFIPTKRKRTH